MPSEHTRLHVQEPAVPDHRRGRPHLGGGIRRGTEADHQTAAEYVPTSPPTQSTTPSFNTTPGQTFTSVCRGAGMFHCSSWTMEILFFFLSICNHNLFLLP